MQTTESEETLTNVVCPKGDAPKWQLSCDDQMIFGYPKFQAIAHGLLKCWVLLGIAGLRHNWVRATSAHQPWEDRQFGRLITGQ